MKWVGLTGGIATGKSTVKKLIEGRGYRVIDADLISHQVTQVGAPGHEKVVAHFGTEFISEDQSLNRPKLGALIFNNPEKRDELEKILHPLIQAEVIQQKEIAFKKGERLCFYDVPLLFEKDLAAQFDRVILVWCDPATQRARLALRSHLDEAEINSRLGAQMRMAYKIKKADHCLDNSTDLIALDKQVALLFGLTSSLSQPDSSPRR